MKRVGFCDTMFIQKKHNQIVGTQLGQDAVMPSGKVGFLSVWVLSDERVFLMINIVAFGSYFHDSEYTYPSSTRKCLTEAKHL